MGSFGMAAHKHARRERMIMRGPGAISCLSSIALSLLTATGVAASEPGSVGVTTAATLISTGTPPNKNERILEVGTDLFANERVKTSESGRVQLMFGDGSSLLVGPNSSVMLDRYVYNPNKKIGEIVLSATAGAFRYIGGAISKTRAVEITTPVGTIGIRGGINQFTVDPSDGRVTTTHIFGIETTITIPNGDGKSDTTTFARQEFQAVILPGGQISFSRMTSDQFDQINSFFERPLGVALAGLPAAGGVGGGPINVPSVGNMGSGSNSGAQFSGSAFASIPKPAGLSAIRSFTPPPIVPPLKNVILPPPPPPPPSGAVIDTVHLH